MIYTLCRPQAACQFIHLAIESMVRCDYTGVKIQSVTIASRQSDDSLDQQPPQRKQIVLFSPTNLAGQAASTPVTACQ